MSELLSDGTPPTMASSSENGLESLDIVVSSSSTSSLGTAAVGEAAAVGGGAGRRKEPIWKSLLEGRCSKKNNTSKLDGHTSDQGTEGSVTVPEKREKKGNSISSPFLLMEEISKTRQVVQEESISSLEMAHLRLMIGRGDDQRLASRIEKLQERGSSSIDGTHLKDKEINSALDGVDKEGLGEVKGGEEEGERRPSSSPSASSKSNASLNPPSGHAQMEKIHIHKEANQRKQHERKRSSLKLESLSLSLSSPSSPSSTYKKSGDVREMS